VGAFPSIHISDYSAYYSQLALQGPRALETLQKLTKVDLAAIKNYWFTWGTVAGIPNVLIARTGYSGEDGFEVYIPADEPTSVKMWNALMDAGSEFAIRPCGLGARNTLRLEAGMSLYGHEISEEINVFEAGLARSSASKWSTAASLATGTPCIPSTAPRSEQSPPAPPRRSSRPASRWRWYRQKSPPAVQTCWCSAVPIQCEQSRCRCRSTSGRKSKRSAKLGCLF
jgi:hypothetical protein